GRGERDAGEPRCDFGIVDGDAGDGRQPRHPGEYAITEMAVPAVEVEIGEKEDDEGRRQADLHAGPPDLLASRRYGDDFGEEAEIDADIGKDGPCERRGRGEERGSLDYE